MALLTGCVGDDGTGPGSTAGTGPDASDGAPPMVGFETLQGTYAGAIASTSQGFTYAADLSVVFSQFGSGGITGSFAIEGTLTLGTMMGGVEGTGSLTGIMERGLDPSLTITFVNHCPGYSALFAGTLDSETRLLTISGPAHILVDCQVVLTFQSTILMDPIVQAEGA